MHRASDVMFAVPNIVDTYLIERCGKETMHTDEHQLAARLRVLKAARDFERAVEKEQFRLGRAMHDVYPQVRARSPDEFGKVTTMQVARMLDATPNVPIVTLFAVHKQLMGNADEFVCHPSRHRFMHTFEVRPLSHLQNIERVKEIVRRGGPIIRNFQEKAKSLIDRSRELTAASVGEGPSRTEILDIEFTEQEQEIITFLRLSLSQGRRIQEDSYQGNIPAIIKGTYRYEELITPFTVLKFLREIGVYTPWEDMGCKDRDLYLPDVSENVILPPVTKDTLDQASLVAAATTPGLLTEDAHESIRHDFGNLPVYVIDDVSAEELDDGISIEPVPGEPNTDWIHVHVADPTAVLPITHPLSQQIQKRTESLYFGYQTWPMLPQDIGAICDMGRADILKAGQNVLTFSAKIGPDGEIKDHKVRAGRVHNVHKLRYDDVNMVLLNEALSHKFYPFEPDTTAAEAANIDVSPVLPHEGQLKRLYEVSRRIVQERVKRGIFAFSVNNAEVSFVDRPVLQNPTRVVQPIMYRGYPRLQYSVSDAASTERGSRSLVAECMKAAGRVASRFCEEHKIPTIRRTMPPVSFLDDATRDRVINARSEEGLVDAKLLLQEGVSFPAGELTTAPVGHWGLGVPDGEGYVRATSPLRRAEDMLVHWQIKSALLPGNRFPIDADAMNRLVADLNGRKMVVKTAYRAHRRQWTHTYIQRFMEAKAQSGGIVAGVDPMRNMDAFVSQNPVYNIVRWSLYQDVTIPILGLNAVVAVDPGVEIPVGTRIKVNAKTVFQYDLNQTLEVELA